MRELQTTKTPHRTRPIISLSKQVVSTNDSRFLTLPSYSYGMHIDLYTRGGVEDTRLEAKARAKDTKKNPRPRPRTALPRTDPLEAKDRNALSQGHKRKCSQKKKVFKNFFHAFSSKKRHPKFFVKRSTKFNNSKKSAVLEPRTGQFSRTWGLEAKDLIFEAKDFKMFPRGQRRPQGLHFWPTHSTVDFCCRCSSLLSRDAV